MNREIVGQVAAKELKETLRDRRTLMVMLVVPIFLYPAMLLVVQQLTLFGPRQLEEAPVRVAAHSLPPALWGRLQTDSTISFSTVDAIPIEEVRGGELELGIAVVSTHEIGGPSSRVEIYFDPSRDRSRLGREAVLEHVTAWEEAVLEERVAEQGLPPTFANPVEVSEQSVASPERMGGYTLGRFLPMILILMTLLGAFYPAIDLSAGEKERGTLEPLLTTAAPAGEIVAGKFLTVTLISVVAATLNLVSMLLTFRLAAFQLGSATSVQLTIPWSSSLLVVVLVVPLAVFFAALFLGLALRAQSFKEAQNSLTPVQLAAIVPMMLPLIPGIPLSYPLALLPIGGIALLFRELMTGELPVGPAIVALLATIAYAAAALQFAARSFGREEVLFGSVSQLDPGPLRERFGRWRSAGHRAPTPTEALAFIAAAGLLFFYIAPVFQIRLGERGILLSQVLLLGAPAILFARWAGYGSEAGLGLRVPTPRQLLACVLVILGAVPLAWVLGWLQSFFFEIPEEFLQAFQELIRADSAREILWLLILVALTPAICEELAFRGILLRGLENGWSAGRAVGGSAAIFGLFHLSFETAIRFLPSAWLGAVLGYVAWRTGSTLVTMLMHFINNGLIVLIVAFPVAEAWVMREGGAPEPLVVAVGVMLLVSGLHLLRGERRQSLEISSRPAAPDRALAGRYPAENRGE